MRNCKLSWTLVVVLALIVAFSAYKFTAGSVEPSDDGRLAVKLSKDERNALLVEMRTWLISSQAVLAAATNKDFAEVARVATISGMAAEAATPGSLFAKIPLEMKKLGFDTRGKFDAIAADAVKMKDSEHTIKQLSIAMNNCIACHATYAFVDEAKK